MERQSANRQIPQLTEIAVEDSSGGQLLLPAPPKTRSGRAAAVVSDQWNSLRNDVRLMVEDHMFSAPLIALAAGFLAGRLVHAALSKPREYTRGW